MKRTFEKNGDKRHKKEISSSEARSKRADDIGPSDAKQSLQCSCGRSKNRGYEREWGKAGMYRCPGAHVSVKERATGDRLLLRTRRAVERNWKKTKPYGGKPKQGKVTWTATSRGSEGFKSCAGKGKERCQAKDNKRCPPKERKSSGVHAGLLDIMSGWEKQSVNY